MVITNIAHLLTNFTDLKTFHPGLRGRMQQDSCLIWGALEPW